MIMMSLISKSIHIVFTILIARTISKHAYATANIYLSFIHFLIVNFPKDVLRPCATAFCHNKSDEIENRKYEDTCQLTWLINSFLFFFSISLFFIFIRLSPELINYRIHIVIYIFSALMEISVEPIAIYLNVKIESRRKCFVMFFYDYSLLILLFFFAEYAHLDLWAFTLSRFCTSALYMCYMLILGLYKFNISRKALVPSGHRMKYLLKLMLYKNLKDDRELFDLLLSELSSWSLGIMLTISEKCVLSFFLICNENDKADYIFVKENFGFFFSHFLRPAAENFYNLLNKIKNYQELMLSSSSDNLAGDFSFKENQYLVQRMTCHEVKRKNNESYSFRLLQTSIRLYFVIGIIVVSFISLLGQDILAFLFTDKWADDHSFEIFRLYALYFSLKAIASNFDSYSSAIYPSDISEMVKGFKRSNVFLLLALSFSLPQIDICGLVWANIIHTVFSIILHWYFTVKNEITNLGRPMKDELIHFAKKSFLRSIGIISTISCIIIITLLNRMNTVDQVLKAIVSFANFIIILCNCIIIIFTEKAGFLEIFRLKINK